MPIFMSYSRTDEAVVKSLVQGLEAARKEVWFDSAVGGGDPWWDLILENIRGTSLFLFAVSDESLQSKPCRTELDYAIALDRPILPVQVGPTATVIGTPLAEVQVIPFRSDDAQSAFAILAAVNDVSQRARPLPDPMPLPPPIPYGYLLALGREIDGPGELNRVMQLALVDQLRRALADETEDTVQKVIIRMLLKLQHRPWTMQVTGREIERVLREHRDGPDDAGGDDLDDGPDSADLDDPAGDDPAGSGDAAPDEEPRAEKRATPAADLERWFGSLARPESPSVPEELAWASEPPTFRPPSQPPAAPTPAAPFQAPSAAPTPPPPFQSPPPAAPAPPPPRWASAAPNPSPPSQSPPAAPTSTPPWWAAAALNPPSPSQAPPAAPTPPSRPTAAPTTPPPSWPSAAATPRPPSQSAAGAPTTPRPSRSSSSTPQQTMGPAPNAAHAPARVGAAPVGGPEQRLAGPPTAPPSALWPLSVIAFLLNIVFGGLALYFSAQVGQRLQVGDLAGATKASNLVKLWSALAAVALVVVFIIIVIVVRRV